MGSKSDLVHIVHDVAALPEAGKTIAQGTTGAGAMWVGISQYLGYFEKGVGLAAACMGLLVTIALYRKLRLERREIELRVLDMERRIADMDESPPSS